MLREIRLMAILNIKRQAKKTIPVLIGFFLATLLAQSITIGSATIYDVMINSIVSQSSLRQITVSTLPTPGSGGELKGLNQQTMQSLSTIPYVEGVDPEFTQNYTTSNFESYSLSLSPLPSSTDARPKLLAGKWPDSGEIAVPASGVMTKNSAGSIVKEIGSSLLNQAVTINLNTLAGKVFQVNLNIVGVYQDTPHFYDSSSYADLSTIIHLMAISQQEDDTTMASEITYSAILVTVDAPTHTSQVADMIEKQGFQTVYVEQSIKNLASTLITSTLIAQVITAIVLLMTLFGIMNLLSSGIAQRQREIGIMLTIGYEPRFIGSVVYLESAILGLLGWLFASLMIGITIIVVNYGITSVHLNDPWWIFPTSVLVMLFTAILGARFPARRAMKLDPIQSMREDH